MLRYVRIQVSLQRTCSVKEKSRRYSDIQHVDIIKPFLMEDQDGTDFLLINLGHTGIKFHMACKDVVQLLHGYCHFWLFPAILVMDNLELVSIVFDPVQK